MKQLLAIGVLVAVAVAVTGQSLVGRAVEAQAPPAGAPASPPANPLDSLHFRAIGPASMSGRVSDLAVYQSDPAIYYVGTAHGGVWKTTNNGTTFEPQMQDIGLMSIGDLAVSQSNPDLVWVATGESNNRQSTSWGDGVYKSTDGGKTYTNVGLRTSRQVNRVVIDPRDYNVVFVAATGSLWGPGGDRGVFKTTDGGTTWKKVLYVDEDTGANDLVMDATNNRILYASTYQRRRTACCMNGGGPGSGIWKSTDAGETWTRLKGGLPEGALGRIAIDVSRKRPNVLYALVEGPSAATGGRGGASGAEEGPGTAPAAGGQAGARGSAAGVNSESPTGLYRSNDSGATWKKVNNANPRPMYFSQVRIDPNDPEVVYLGGVKMHQSRDGGATISTNVTNTIHDDVHAIWIDPANSNHLVIGGDGGVAESRDMAKTWVYLPNLPLGTFYHVSYDMATPYNVCGGAQDNYDWCGPSAVRGAAGIANYHWVTVQGGDGFVVLQDPSDRRVVYSESQDGNITRWDRTTNESMSIRPQPRPGEAPYRWHWDTPLILSPHDPKVLWTAANRVFRSPDWGMSWVAASGDSTSGASRDDIVTMGVKNTETRIARNDGIAAWPAIVSLAESPRRPGLLYAGTDDGRLAVSKDAGRTWTQVIDKVAGLPKDIYVSEVVPSRFDEGTVYATFDGHRQNDFASYVYTSGDYGQTWKPVAGNLKDEVARTLTEDLKNRDVLYLGTETGLFVTLDRGRSWTRIKANLPTVRIDEITLHPRDNAMILATHGRSIWILDHLEPIQELAAVQAAPAEAKLFSPPPSSMFRRPARDRNYEFWGDRTFFGENPPQAALVSWLAKKPAGEVKLKITDATGKEVREIAGPALAASNKAGYQAACWDLRVQPLPAPAGPAGGRGGTGAGAPAAAQGSAFGAGCTTGGGFGGGFGAGAATLGPYVLPGIYTVSLIVDGNVADTKPLRVDVDPEVALSPIERKELFDKAMEMHELQRRASEVSAALQPFNTRMSELAKEIDGRNDVPPDVKASFQALNKDVATLLPRFQAGFGGRGGGAGGGGGATPNPSVLARIGQAKTGLMGGFLPTAQTLDAYNDAKVATPKAISEANALFEKAVTVSGALAAHKLTLAAPKRVGTPAVVTATQRKK